MITIHIIISAPGRIITGPLRAGDVELGIAAQAKYHVFPGEYFTDEYGRTWRFADRSGSRDPLNVDVFPRRAGRYRAQTYPGDYRRSGARGRLTPFGQYDFVWHYKHLPLTWRATPIRSRLPPRSSGLSTNATGARLWFSSERDRGLGNG